MKKIALAVIASLLLPTSLSAQVYVKGYTKKDGTYVAPHYRSTPNSSKLDNYSTKGNINPYTGKVGTKDVYSSPSYGWSGSSSSSYGSSTDDDYESDTYGDDPE